MRQYLLTLDQHQHDLLFKLLEHEAEKDPHGFAHELLVTLPMRVVVCTQPVDPDKVIPILYKRDPDNQSRRIDQEKLVMDKTESSS